MFRIPESLAQLGQERIEGCQVEGFVYGAGPKNPELMLIGEAPGEFELVDGIPFIGRAGNELMQSLASIGLTREDVYMTSTVRSRPYKWGVKKKRDGTLLERKYNRPPIRKEILAHAPLLDYELIHVNPKLIVTLGNVGLGRLFGTDAKVTALHGHLLEQPIQYLHELDDTHFSLTEKTYEVVPTFHPAAVFYRPSYRAVLDEDWLEIGRLLQERK